MVSCAECTSSSGGFIIAAVSVASFYTFFRKEGKVLKTKNQTTHTHSRIAIYASKAMSTVFLQQVKIISYQQLATLISANCSMVPKRVLIRECKHWQHDCRSPTTVDRLKIKDLCISYIDYKGTR